MTASATTFLRSFLLWSFGAFGLAAAFIWLVDPYGVSPFRLPIARPIMDINQRYMYPQLARSGEFDSALIGTSTSRLLDPRQLDAAFGARFANLAMNAATAWEQTEIAKLFLRHPQPRAFMIGLDQMWCQDERSIVRITFRGFPAWMYDENRWNDLPELVSLKSLEITGRLAAFHLGLMPERIRRDGYEVFTPPEETYDPARARFHIWQGYAEPKVTAVEPPVALSEQQREALRFPAVAWLDDLLTAASGARTRLIAFMPLHVAAQPPPGSEGAARIALCLERIAAVARRHGVPFIDFAIPSDVTSNDSNYWDPLHYRLPIAARIVEGLKAAAAGAPSSNGLYVTR